ncbi:MULTISPECIES: type II secretion system minor pseudopilin GspJ [unclassified Pseudoalteromonas]|uniref:type II secretion system minor pseudopilin GspJ n=1 Tax=unclassified Pseudoalteromonas TaxID=194690 RepID=UPI001109BB20|nr:MULTISPECIES: type II secretion system minor pseudopilin GspJ [unclassified Pseudoalteromonas]TMN77353.1 type II secretion system protein GspJ [Pseudoalteromonas sp. S410]TMN87321.1 type II secretion system protein GspJ [Pseudoalteromonas sp. S408]TMN95763.1 type II secretion system protein GspJ [Pseudoalteromonas sp. S407]TMN96121.1 type II secretion system protein GspJ [Pseudoalteromonas sp. S409]TMO09036.1 type II secretion system protein GspJ [Pseudoalteromonas sp. S186]
MKQRGFTLLEVMVALGILAFVVISTHQILDSTTKAKDASDEKIAELNGLQTTFRLMDQDFSQMTKRAVRNESGDVQEYYLLAGRYVLESQYDGIVFVRDGWINPINLLPRSELQAVGYRVMDDNLERVYRVYVDQLDNMEPRVQQVLENVEELKFEFLDSDNKWQEQWEVKALPKAVAVTLQQIEAEPIRRVFLVPGQGSKNNG